LRGAYMPCGTDGGYVSVFRGSVVSVTELADDEKRLVLKPEEVFLGTPAENVTVTTNQGPCIGELRAGDDWLFYVRKDNRVSYGDSNMPVREAGDVLRFLRSLKQTPTRGAIRGYVSVQGNPQVPTKHDILLRDVKSGASVRVVSDTDGLFELLGLPEATYRISANTTDGLWAEDVDVPVHALGCSYVTFELLPDSSLSGRVTGVGGRPFQHQRNDWQIVAVRQDDGESSWQSAFMKDDGRFEFRGLAEGDYLLGMGIGPAAQSSRLHMYYPGVTEKSRAMLIHLGKSQKKSGIDFSVPELSAKP
jgi:hypothetical protein